MHAHIYISICFSNLLQVILGEIHIFRTLTGNTLFFRIKVCLQGSEIQHSGWKANTLQSLPYVGKEMEPLSRWFGSGSETNSGFSHQTSTEPFKN